MRAYVVLASTLPLQEGDIWPNTQAEVSITFSPYKAIRYIHLIILQVAAMVPALPLATPRLPIVMSQVESLACPSS